MTHRHDTLPALYIIDFRNHLKLPAILIWMAYKHGCGQQPRIEKHPCRMDYILRLRLFDKVFCALEEEAGLDGSDEPLLVLG